MSAILRPDTNIVNIIILNCVSVGSGISIVPLMTALTNKPKNYVYKRLAENPSRAIVSVNYKNRTKKDLSLEF